ncbi:VTI1 [Candida theae]|uniref:VTI1 n=1 Tax=Candida theae TaxID=1198502 RepID=A0AAD5BFH4_9ASCO|nr:VTI1 [Candida theae]KAI5958317.1 VTI1 [Candida theae]
MSDSFNTYESDFQLALQEAKTKISQVESVQGEQRQSYLKAIEAATDEALEALDQMGIEVQNLPTTQRSSYNTKIRQYKSQIDEAKAKYKKLSDSQDRHELFGSRYRDEDGGAGGLNGVSDSQRKQLLNNQSSLERSSQRLQDSQRIALETESIGGNILNDLRSQREQIGGARNTLMQADTYVDRSIQTLKKLHITFITKDGQQYTYEVAEGDNILDIAQAHNLDMEGACGGSCACSTCHVIVDPEFYDEIPEPSDDENDMLDLAFGLTETSRLGCQVKMSKELDGIRVALPAMTRNLQNKDFN